MSAVKLISILLLVKSVACSENDDETTTNLGMFTIFLMVFVFPVCVTFAIRKSWKDYVENEHRRKINEVTISLGIPAKKNTTDDNAIENKYAVLTKSTIKYASDLTPQDSQLDSKLDASAMEALPEEPLEGVSKKGKGYVQLVRSPSDIDAYELDPSKVLINTDEPIGKGSFGNVYKGRLVEKDIFVAIKRTKANAYGREEDDFVKEARVAIKLDTHHIVKIYGYVLKSKPYAVVMEFMHNGDLHTFLRNSVPPRPEVNSEYQVMNAATPTVAQMAIQIADGMFFMENQQTIHCDLAARNCMIDENFKVKVGDFGMAREIHGVEYYRANVTGKLLPQRWLAPESFTLFFTSKSDVFSFGVLLWELVTYCRCRPYEVSP